MVSPSKSPQPQKPDSKVRKTTASRLMRRALDGLADESVRSAPTSCYELVRDLFESPSRLDSSKDGDRSTNKERLRSFGKRSLK